MRLPCSSKGLSGALRRIVPAVLVDVSVCPPSRKMTQGQVSTARLDAERRFRRVRGFWNMPQQMLTWDNPSTHFKQPEIAA